MPCYRPLTAYHTTGGGITFNRSKSFGTEIQLPCRRCIGCRLEKAKEWALRCSHEALLYDDGLNNSFITLTYRNEDLPPHGNLRKIDFQKFIRALRKKTKQKIRYYMCGEYGDKTNRPHYHALLFGFQFRDRKFVNTRNANRVYTSQLLNSTWKLGDCEIGSVNFKSAGYVARYIVKKQNGDPNELFERYVIINKETGEMSARHNEYTNMSLKPGIGEKFYLANKMDFFPHDFAVTPDGRQMPVPSYYQGLLKKSDPDLYQSLLRARIERAQSDPNSNPERLLVREKCHAAKAKKLIRDYL